MNETINLMNETINLIFVATVGFAACWAIYKLRKFLKMALLILLILALIQWVRTTKAQESPMAEIVASTEGYFHPAEEVDTTPAEVYDPYDPAEFHRGGTF